MSKGLSLRDRLIGNLPEIAPWARRLPWLFNLAWFVQSYLGFAKQRSLPKWRSDTFLATTDVDRSDATVVIFADTFSNNFEPDLLHAARRVLQAAGHRVAVAWPTSGAPALCCGRTFLATGQVDEGQERGAPVAAGAAAVRRQGRAGRRPGAVVPVHLARRVPGLGLGEDAQAVCDNAFLFEEFLAREKKAGRLKLDAQAAAAEDGAAARPLPPEGVRRDERGAGGAGAGARPRRQR